MRRTCLPLLVLAAALSALPGAAAHDTPASMSLRGADNGGRDDHLRAYAPASYRGETVQLLRRDSGDWRVVREKVLNDDGNARFVVTDHDGRATTRYRARVRPEDPGLPALVATRRVR